MFALHDGGCSHAHPELCVISGVEERGLQRHDGADADFENAEAELIMVSPFA